MMAASGTEVVVDLLFFQRRAPGQEPAGAVWDELAEVLPATDGEGPLHANRYFAEHPEMVLGNARLDHQLLWPGLHLPRPWRGSAGAALMAAAIDRLPRGIHRPPVESTSGSAERRSVTA